MTISFRELKIGQSFDIVDVSKKDDILVVLADKTPGIWLAFKWLKPHILEIKPTSRNEIYQPEKLSLEECDSQLDKSCKDS